MGYYKCIRCGGTDAYSSQENGRTFAVTLDTPGDVDPTMFNTIKETVVRCRKCGEKCRYIQSPDEQKEDMRIFLRVFLFIILGILGFLALLFVPGFLESLMSFGDWLFGE